MGLLKTGTAKHMTAVSSKCVEIGEDKMATVYAPESTEVDGVSEVPRRRPIERPIGLEGFWAKWGKWIVTVLNFTIFIVLWEVIAQQGLVSRLLLPPFSEVVEITRELAEEGTLWKHLQFSGTNFIVGFLIAAVLGIPLGLLLGASKKLDLILGPYVWIFFSTPRLALLPLITVALGFGMASKVFLIFIGAFFVIVINTWAGVKTVEPQLIHAGRVFGASQPQVFRKIIIPYTLPFIIVGLRLGVTRALVVTVVAEMLASSRGMGYLIIRAVDAFKPEQLFSMIVILVIVSMVMVTGLRRLEEWVAPWREVEV
jgi:NitT/TauT family transport system permease protein